MKAAHVVVIAARLGYTVRLSSVLLGSAEHPMELTRALRRACFSCQLVQPSLYLSLIHI